ncbi:MAG: hypothetical protein CMK41_05005 [Porticoccaceae bacterium]|nr:hypothetical protein [Porticoccaceae bacterium]|tara:strand:- start:40 stop:756 length:717 start_codon:yes stop_codon:yes gene_type:complete
MKIRFFKSKNGIFPKEIHEEFERVFVNGEKLNAKFLSDSKYSSELSVNNGKDLDIKNESQFKIAKAIAESLGGKSKIKTYRDKYGLWLWLTFAYADLIFGEDKEGKKKILRQDNYWPNDVKDYQTAARHRIRGLCMMYASHGDNADFLLNRPLSVRGELMENLSQSPEFTDKTIYLTFRKLFWNASKKSAKKGYASKVCGARDLVSDIKKLMYTHAVELMTVDELIEILHPRFKDKWL